MSIKFDQMDICPELKERLTKAGFIVATEIQAGVLQHVLAGKDVIASAKTGSGKTLAFVVPMLNILITNKVTPWDGVQAIILSPTRELSYQTYTAINNIFGVPIKKLNLDISIGLSIGGKDCKREKEYISRNVLVCTPGRLKEHIETNPYFNCDSFRLLIIDEADQMVDPGFIRDVSHIIENLPKSHQTLVFSATLSDSVKLLCKKLNLKNPVKISIHQLNNNNLVKIPEQLIQRYFVCELEEKLNFLFSFIKGHRGEKLLVFMASCKQVKYVYELFCKLRPGSPLIALYGTLHQLRRMAIYDEFSRKQNIVLFATDLAARGLDFPSVDWVLQLDCPDDVKTYIHRAGRTARANKGGQNVLVLLPSEEKAMLAKLHEQSIDIRPFSFHHRIYSIQRRAETFCAMDVNLKESAQRAFKSYFKSIFLMKDKDVFNFKCLNKDSFARSLGLLLTPRIRLLEKTKPGGNLVSKKDPKVTSEKPENIIYQESSTKDNKWSFLDGKISDEDDENDACSLFTVKNSWKFDGTDKNDLPIAPLEVPIELNSLKRKKNLDKLVTKAAMVKKLVKKKIKPNTNIKFDADGNAIEEVSRLKPTSDKVKQIEEASLNRHGGGIDIELAKQLLREEDVLDKKLQHRLINEKHKEKKRKQKQENKKKREKERKDDTFACTLEANDTISSDGDDVGDFYDDETSKYIDLLPDPDVVYASDEEIVEDDQCPASIVTVKEKSKRKKIPSSFEFANDEEFNLSDKETLALHVLKA